MKLKSLPLEPIQHIMEILKTAACQMKSKAESKVSMELDASPIALMTHAQLTIQKVILPQVNVLLILYTVKNTASSSAKVSIQANAQRVQNVLPSWSKLFVYTPKAWKIT